MARIVADCVSEWNFLVNLNNYYLGISSNNSLFSPDSKHCQLNSGLMYLMYSRVKHSIISIKCVYNKLYKSNNHYM